MQIPKTFLAACVAAFFVASPSICKADDSAATNAPVAAEIATNAPTTAEIKTNAPVAAEVTTNAPAAVEIATNAPTTFEAKTNTLVTTEIITNAPVVVGVKTNAPAVPAMKPDDTKQARKDAPKATTMKGAPVLMPLPAPPLPISEEKHQALLQLLQKYKADQITPEEYHAGRAKILAGP